MPVAADEFDLGEQPSCPMCGTVMQVDGGGYSCGGCGFLLPIASVERPDDGDLPGIRGG
jgi:ribosomal protein S27AE